VVGTFPITPFNPSTVLVDGTIGAELASQIQANHLPPPNDNTLYAVHVPASFTLNQCMGVGCASHRWSDVTISGASVRLQFSDVSDFLANAQCDPHGCLADPFENVTTVASHELYEAVTDPQPFSNARAWTTADGAEIADLCPDSYGTISAPNGMTYAVHSYYSRSTGSCPQCATAACSATGVCTPGSGCTLRGQNASFSDAASVYEGAAANNGWIAPCAMSSSGALFCPSSTISRADLATVVIRALFGDSFSFTMTPYFSDVHATDWRFPYVQKLRDLGITIGTSNGPGPPTFSPEVTATRRDAAVFVMRAYALHAFGGIDAFTACTNPFFTDVPTSDIAFRYIQEMRSLGFTQGTSASTYSPDVAASRENIAVFAERAFDPIHFGDRVPAACP
jgi:hypothetical protein